MVALAVPAAVCGGEALPVNAISSVALGWGIAAGLHLAVGSPLGPPSAAEVTEWITDLNVAVADITRAPRQVWGVEQFTGHDTTGKSTELSVYGRDASDAGVLAKLWRFCLYRDSGPTLILDRLQQVEHEAYLTLMAGRAGVGVPGVLAAGRFGPSGDAAPVTRVPDGPALAQATEVADGMLDEILLAVLRLRATGLAHGALAATPSSCPIRACASGTSAVRPLRARPADWPPTWRPRWPRWRSRRAPSARPQRPPGYSTPTSPAAPWCTCSARRWTRTL